MNKKALENIFNNLNFLIEDFKDFPETEEAENNFWQFVKENISAEPSIEFENALYDFSYSHQMQGFIYGFKYAISLLI